MECNVKSIKYQRKMTWTATQNKMSPQTFYIHAKSQQRYLRLPQAAGPLVQLIHAQNISAGQHMEQCDLKSSWRKRKWI